MSETKRKILIIIVLLLVILFGVGQFFAGGNVNTANQQSPSTPNTNPLATQIITYTPNVPASSTPTVKGSCFANSVAAPYRSDAWRCMAGNAISDPCFGIAGTSNVLCGADPASANTSSSFVMEATNQLPAWQAPSGTIPSYWAWLVELDDGTVCSPFTGTRPFTATGQVAMYSCNGQAAGEDMIFGDLNNATGTWTAEVGSLSTSTKIFPPVIVASATVPVFAVWQ
jgi:hypothetical protein